MATVRFSQLPETASVQPTDVLVVEDGSGVVRRATVSQLPGTGGGSAWYDGPDAPIASLGTDGDYYLDTATGDLFTKSSGAWSVIGNLRGPTGSQGPAGTDGADGADGVNGADGATWRDGVGAPNNTLGADGDLYLDTETGDIYRRAAGVYFHLANIRGATGATGPQGPAGVDGADGAAWHSGSGVPGAAIGADGDHYLSTDSGDVYNRAGGSWSVVGNLRGPEGPAGSGSEYARRSFAGTIAPDAPASYATYTQSGALSFAKGPGAFNGATHVLPFESDGGALSWAAGFVAAHSLAAADLPSSLPAGLQLLVFTYHGQRDEILVSWAHVVAGEVEFAPAGNLSAPTVQAAIEELDAKKLAFPDAGGVEIGNYRISEAAIGNGYVFALADNGKEKYASVPGTATVPALAPPWRCVVWNVSGGDYTLNGPGAADVTLANGEVATIAQLGDGSIRIAKGGSTVIS